MSDEATRPRRLLIEPDTRHPFTTKPAGGWPSVTGTVRPARPVEVQGFLARLARAKDPGEEVRVRTEFYAAQVLSWDVEGEDGQPAPIAPATFARLPYPVYEQFEPIALGYL